jgi:uncharacterized protein YbaP (TraB family)
MPIVSNQAFQPFKPPMNSIPPIRKDRIIKWVLRLCATLSVMQFSPQLLAEEKGFFFEITKNGNIAYVFGSSHAAGVLTFPLRPEIESVLNQAPCIAKELPQNAPATVASMKGSFLLPEGKVLGDQLKPEVRNKLNRFLEKYRYPASKLDRYKVWVAADTIPVLAAMSSSPRDFGSASKSLDIYLMERSFIKGVPMMGIETVIEQYMAKEHLTNAEQQAMLIEVLDADDNQKEAEQWMSHKFANGDIDALRDGYLDKNSHIPAHRKAFEEFVFSRNGRQAERIDEMVRNGSKCVFAIGALHLGGEDGVIRLLKMRGYAARQL